jgi:tetratricopeptide (TPR) repeat protein
MFGSDEPRRGPKAIEIYERLGNLERAVGVMNNMGAFAYLEGNWDEAVEWYERSLEAAERSGNVLEAALTRANIAEVLIGQRRYAEALPLLEEARRVYEASNADYYMPLVELLEARTKLGTGDVEGAIPQLEELVAGEETPWATEIVVALGTAWALEGRTGQALDLIEGREESPGISRVRAQVLASAGDTESAIEELENAIAMATDMGDLFQEAETRAAYVDLARRIGAGPDPADLKRLNGLQSRLGIIVSQPI